jgi:hypothetical protein
VESAQGDSFHNIQGDQIVRIFTHWVIVFIGQFLKITEAPKYLCFFIPHGLIILTKNGLGHILDNSFTNSCGHPDHKLMFFAQIFQGTKFKICLVFRALKLSAVSFCFRFPCTGCHVVCALAYQCKQCKS